MMKRFFLAGLLLCVFVTASYAQPVTPTPANIRCWNGSAFVSCPLQDGGSGAITANTGRVTLGGEPCSGTKLPFSARVSSATTTQLVAASASNKVYICSVQVGPISATANNVGFVEDDTAACASPTAGMMGSTTSGDGWQIAASGGFANNGGNSSIGITAAVNRYVCVITSSAAVTAVWGTYVLAP